MSRTNFLTIFLSASLLTSTSLSGQLSGKVIESNTKKPIPYVNIWVQGTDIGTTSTEEGKFELPTNNKNDSIIFSAVGYSSVSTSLVNFKETVQLMPKPIVLSEVVLYAKKDSKETKASTYNPKKVNNLFTSGMQPKIRARFFPYENKFELTPYLKRLKLCAPSELEGARFIIRFYEKNENGGPGELI